MNAGMTRRRFLAAGAALPLIACRGPGAVKPTPEADGDAGFPLIEVSGTPYETGLAIGKRFGGLVKEGLRRRREWFAGIRTFMEQDPKNRYDPFLAAGERHFPGVVEELRGWADGSGIPFVDLMALQLKNELSTMMHKLPRETPGCSTVVLSVKKRRLIAHNEDGDMAYRDLMFLVKVSQPGKPTFWCLNYPGILSGNGPVMNDAGLVVTTNFISSRAVRAGIPRYFISRAAIQARTLAEAVGIVTHPERAYAFHFNLGSRRERKILSVETSVDRHQVREVEGLYVHTNHLVLPEMRKIEQDDDYVGGSSMSRYRVLIAEAKKLRSRLGEAGVDDIVEALSSHEGAPYSPCRHPVEGVDEPVSGSTLGTACFDVLAGTCRLYHGNPCEEDHRMYRL